MGDLDDSQIEPGSVGLRGDAGVLYTAVTVALTLSDGGYGELTGRYDNVYLSWQSTEEQLTALRWHINSRPIGEADDIVVLAQFDQQTARARALRAELAELVIARQRCRAGP